MPRMIRHILLWLLASAAQAQTAAPAEPSAAAPAATPLSLPPHRSGSIDALLGAPKVSGDDFLPPDQAFRFDALTEGSDRVRLNWEIADGYYLYRARIKVATPSATAQLGSPQFPTGQFKTDEYFGRQEIYHHELRVTVPVARAAGGAFALPLEVTYQGCAEKGLCRCRWRRASENPSSKGQTPPPRLAARRACSRLISRLFPPPYAPIV